jgi:hypothetical protein
METANHLTPRAVKIMDMTILGLKPGQIAKSLGLTVAYVSTIIHAPQFQHQLAQRRDRYEEKFDDEAIRKEQEAADLIKQNARKAAEKVIGLLDSDSEAIQLKAGADIMDRAGLTKQNRTGDISQTNIILDEAAVNLITETLKMDKNPSKLIESKDVTTDESKE